MNARVVPEGAVRVGLVVALPAEARTLGPTADAHAVSVCGIGPHCARDAAQTLVGNGVQTLISWGVIGGLVDALRPGDLLLPEVIVGVAQTFHAEPILHARLMAALSDRARVHRDPLWSDSRPALTPAAKRTLAAAHGAAAIDMESAAVAAVAAHAGIPFAAVKAVCDPVERALPATIVRLLQGTGRLATGGLARAVFSGPRVWFDLLAVGRDFSAARQSLRRASPLVMAVLQS